MTRINHDLYTFSQEMHLLLLQWVIKVLKQQSLCLHISGKALEMNEQMSYSESQQPCLDYISCQVVKFNAVFNATPIELG